MEEIEDCYENDTDYDDSCNLDEDKEEQGCFSKVVRQGWGAMRAHIKVNHISGGRVSSC